MDCGAILVSRRPGSRAFSISSTTDTAGISLVGLGGLSHVGASRNHSLKQAGVVAALVAEARTLGSVTRRSDGLLQTGNEILIAVSGMGLAAAGRAAGALVEAGVGALISWGLAGGLDPKLPAGTICLPSEVISDDGALFETNPHWRELVSAAVSDLPVVHGALLSRSYSLDSVAEKAAAFRATAALAVDMESLAIADVAARHGLPFMAVRVIVDTAADAVPRSVAAASASGQVALGRLLSGVLQSPRELPALWCLGVRYRKAVRSLKMWRARKCWHPSHCRPRLRRELHEGVGHRRFRVCRRGRCQSVDQGRLDGAGPGARWLQPQQSRVTGRRGRRG